MESFPPFSLDWMKGPKIAVLIDFEKAYDSVWRERLLVKLFKSGIQGKMWKWIQNFLDERLAKQYRGRMV